MPSLGETARNGDSDVDWNALSEELQRNGTAPGDVITPSHETEAPHTEADQAERANTNGHSNGNGRQEQASNRLDDMLLAAATSSSALHADHPVRRLAAERGLSPQDTSKLFKEAQKEAEARLAGQGINLNGAASAEKPARPQVKTEADESKNNHRNGNNTRNGHTKGGAKRSPRTHESDTKTEQKAEQNAEQKSKQDSAPKTKTEDAKTEDGANNGATRNEREARKQNQDVRDAKAVLAAKDLSDIPGLTFKDTGNFSGKARKEELARRKAEAQAVIGNGGRPAAEKQKTADNSTETEKTKADTKETATTDTDTETSKKQSSKEAKGPKSPSAARVKAALGVLAAKEFSEIPGVTYKESLGISGHARKVELARRQAEAQRIVDAKKAADDHRAAEKAAEKEAKMEAELDRYAKSQQAEIEEYVEQEMKTKHPEITGDIGRATMKENLIKLHVEQDRRERREYIEKNGGLEKVLAAEAAEREADERQEGRDRLHYAGEFGQKRGLNGPIAAGEANATDAGADIDTKTTDENSVHALERPAGVDYKDWLGMTESAKRTAVAKAERLAEIRAKAAAGIIPSPRKRPSLEDDNAADDDADADDGFRQHPIRHPDVRAGVLIPGTPYEGSQFFVGTPMTKEDWAKEVTRRTSHETQAAVGGVAVDAEIVNEDDQEEVVIQPRQNLRSLIADKLNNAAIVTKEGSWTGKALFKAARVMDKWAQRRATQQTGEANPQAADRNKRIALAAGVLVSAGAAYAAARYGLSTGGSGGATANQIGGLPSTDPSAARFGASTANPNTYSLPQPSVSAPQPTGEAIGTFNRTAKTGFFEGYALRNVPASELSQLTKQEQVTFTNLLRTETLNLNGFTEASARRVQPNYVPQLLSPERIHELVEQAKKLR